MLSHPDLARSCSNGFHWHGNTKVNTGETNPAHTNNMSLLKIIIIIKKVRWAGMGLGGAGLGWVGLGCSGFGWGGAGLGWPGLEGVGVG